MHRGGLAIFLTASLLPVIAAAEQPPLKFNRVSIRDPAVNNIEGATLLIPDGWKLEGGFVWMPLYSMQANLLLRISDPASGASVDMLPAQQFSYPLQDVGVQIQPGSNWNGSVLYPPPRDAEEFLRNVFLPSGTLAHLRDAKLVKTQDLPGVAEEAAKAIPAAQRAQYTVRSTRLRYTYALAGRDWEEDVYLTLTYAPQNGWTAMWWCGGQSLRAPAGQLDRMTPILLVPSQSQRLDLQWYATLETVRQMFRQGNRIDDENRRRLQEQWRQNNAEAQRNYQQALDQRQAQQDRQNSALREVLGGIETYKDPYESRDIDLPAGYKSYWVNDKGQYLLSEDPGYDPRVGTTLNWKKMDRATP